MPRHAFSQYNNPSAFACVPKELFRRLLDPYAAACVAHGLDPATLDDDPPSNDRLWTLFSEHTRELPPPLLTAMCRIDDLADEAGQERLIDAAMTRGVQLAIELTNQHARRLAIMMFLDYPELFDVAHGKRVVETTKAFRLFGSTTPRQAKMPERDPLDSLAVRLSGRFKTLGFGRHSRIRPYEEPDQLCFVVSHGRYLNRVEAVEESANDAHESVASFRPQKHDLVVYDNRRLCLMVHAGDPRTVALYRETFAELLLGRGDALDRERMVTGEPLVRRRAAALRAVPGMSRVRLAEVLLEVEAPKPYRVHFRGEDVFSAIDDLDTDVLDRSEVQYAKFRAWYTSGGKPRVIELRPESRVEFDPRKDADVTRAFLDSNGFLVTTSRFETPGALAS